jgi:CubicO group peptidase (beta-lactamase class C family)
VTSLALLAPFQLSAAAADAPQPVEDARDALVEPLSTCIGSSSTEAGPSTPPSQAGGAATASFEAGADGSVQEVQLSASSGFEAVDACIVQVVRAARLPPGALSLTVEVRPGATAGSLELAEIVLDGVGVPGVGATSSCPEPPGPFPGASWPDATAEAPADVVTALDLHLFPPGAARDDPDRLGTRTDGVVIVHRGEIVYERYGPDHGPDTPHLAWSATKSFTNALVGVAVREGRLSLDDTVCELLPGASGGACKVRVVDLLEFTSGFDWLETYEGQSPTASSVLAMLYGEGSSDMARFVAAHPLEHKPGTAWRYSSGDTNVLAAIAGAALAPEHGERFPWAVLLDPIGMTGTTWERDRAGTYVGSSYLWAPPRALARFGQLLLADGCWAGERILPEGWVAGSTQPSPAIRSGPVYGWEPGDVQGRQFWLNQPLPERGQPEGRWPSAPRGAFAALGHWGQSITVIPSAELVVVRTADDRERYDHDRTLQLALSLAEAP